ncbi:hypothetical protein EXIGLDRAFT_744702 [Exidia glandulosa HHB12029]|uniref:Uncharacterized protein n=1 Tax=Exidia glandulosa HHB12029 TaxID=1314781 RepID=A0A165PJC0_EXIGL|nr:hypothetical protein EXIGLDRAFT_744702 [Exidia glandulosa HHB12029]
MTLLRAPKRPVLDYKGHVHSSPSTFATSKHQRELNNGRRDSRYSRPHPIRLAIPSSRSSSRSTCSSSADICAGPRRAHSFSGDEEDHRSAQNVLHSVQVRTGALSMSTRSTSSSRGQREHASLDISTRSDAGQSQAQQFHRHRHRLYDAYKRNHQDQSRSCPSNARSYSYSGLSSRGAEDLGGLERIPSHAQQFHRRRRRLHDADEGEQQDRSRSYRLGFADASDAVTRNSNSRPGEDDERSHGARVLSIDGPDSERGLDMYMPSLAACSSNTRSVPNDESAATSVLVARQNGRSAEQRTEQQIVMHDGAEREKYTDNAVEPDRENNGNDDDKRFAETEWKMLEWRGNVEVQKTTRTEEAKG